MTSKSKLCVAFGKRIRELRENKGFSQESFADQAHLHRTYLGGVERGERNPTLTMLDKIAKALKISLADLLDGVNAKES